MNILTILGSIIGFIGMIGGAAAWFKRSEGLNTINLLKTNISSYETSEQQHLRQIAELQAIVAARDDTIKELRNTIRNMTKAFKEYKDDAKS